MPSLTSFGATATSHWTRERPAPAATLPAVSGGINSPSRMPIYEYRCTKCRKRFSDEQTISAHDKRRPTCPKCKSRAVEPIFSTFFAKTGRKS
jgi:putative FmdB family regulatory protein